jgi:hypothetical protein
LPCCASCQTSKQWGSTPVLFFYNTKLNKLDTQKLRIEIMSLSYHPSRLADVFVRVVAMHRWLALPVPLRHDYELIGWPVATESVSDLRILNQAIDLPEGAAPWLDRSRGPRVLYILFWHLLHEHFASRRSPTKGSFKKFITISILLAECALLSLNPPYIAHRCRPF